MRRLTTVGIGLAALVSAAALTPSFGAETKPRPDFRVLVFAEPASYHYSIGSVEPAIEAIEAIGERRGFGVAARVDPSVFRSDYLRRFDAIVLLSPDGEMLGETQQAAFERFIGNGGGFVGVHAASLTEGDWPFFVDLVGARFVSHPPIQAATVRVEDRAHPATQRLPRPWVRTDEWYEFDRNPRGDVHVLAAVDESTYEGGAMGGDHPISWCRRYQGGRSFYTAMGHEAGAYAEPALRRHLLGAIRWAAGDAPGDCSR